MADIRPYALDYALCAMFIALIVLQIQKRMQVLVVFVSGGLAVGLMQLGVDQVARHSGDARRGHPGRGDRVVDQEKIFLTLLGMAAVTYLPRLLPSWLLASRRLPGWLETWLRQVPVAVLSAMLFPALFTADGKLNLAWNNFYMWAAIPAALVAWKFKSMFGAVLVGMMVVAGFRFFVG